MKIHRHQIYYLRLSNTSFPQDSIIYMWLFPLLFNSCLHRIAMKFNEIIYVDHKHEIILRGFELCG